MKAAPLLQKSEINNRHSSINYTPSQDERLRVLGDEFQQLGVSPVAGFVDRLGE
jgi:hypothetical protein